MRVALWMTPDLVAAEPGATISDCARLMVRRRTRHLLVVSGRAEGGDRLAGIVSRYDLARAFPPDANPFAADPPEIARPISDVMTRDVATIDFEAPIEEAAQAMLARSIRALPVLREGRLAGMITLSDVARAFVSAAGASSRGVEVTFAAAPGDTLLGALLGQAESVGLEISSLITLEREGRKLCVVRFHGPGEDRFIDAIRKSGRAVLAVERVRPRRSPA